MTDVDGEFKRQIDEVLNADDTILKACRKFHETISPTVDAICDHVQIQAPSRELVYRCITKRAHENLGMIVGSADSSYPYLSVMPLRPLCEDMIYGAWLRTLPKEDADRLVELSTLDDILKSIDAQNSFLPKVYDKFSQSPDGGKPLVNLPAFSPIPVVSEKSSDSPRFVHKQELKALGLKLGWPKGKLPNIREMARIANLSETYEFFYHGSSKAVHASLHNMGRMVWGDPQSGEFTITSRNFENYYRLFALSYGMWLVAEIVDRIISAEFPEEFELIDKTEYSVWLAMVIAGLARNGALPPLVTAEELRWPQEPI